MLYHIKTRHWFSVSSSWTTQMRAAKHAIHTFKNHFIAGLCTTDKNFPLHLWDKVIPQAIMALSSCINPKLSAWAQVHGNYNFNHTPIAPPGIKVLVQKEYLGTPCCCRMVHRTSPTSLLMLLHMDNGNKMRTNSWHNHMVPYHCTHANDIFPRHHSQCNTRHPARTPKSHKQLSNCTNNRHRNQNPEKTCHHTTQQNNGWTWNTYNSDTPALLRVTPEAMKTEQPQTEPDTTYHQTSKPKKQMNKHKQQCGKLATWDEDTGNTANYTMQLLQQADTHTHHYCFSVIHPNTGLPTKYQDLQTSSEGAKWLIKTADEIGWLALGNKETQVQGTNTMFFIRKSDIPMGCKPSYLWIVTADCPNKEWTKWIWFMVGGNRTDVAAHPSCVLTSSQESNVLCLVWQLAWLKLLLAWAS